MVGQPHGKGPAEQSERFLLTAGFEKPAGQADEVGAVRTRVGLIDVGTLGKLEVNGPDVDAVIQVGTNLSMVRLAAEAEQWLGKPVIAINTATYWHALRKNGITDKIYGLGRLLEEF